MSDLYDLVVIGGGPGGYTAAVRAAQLGLKTVCVERRPRLGGVCLNVGCIPSKALLDSSEYFHLAKTQFAGHGIQTGEVAMDIGRMMARKDQVVKDLTDNVRKLLEAHRVEIIHGTATLAGKERVEVAGDLARTLEARHIILATGSEPAAIPGIAFDGKRIVSSTEALQFDSVPQRLGVIGGGYIGIELGSVWLRLGAKVTVIEMLPDIVSSMDGQVSRRLLRVLKKQGFDFRLESRVTAAGVDGENVKVEVETAGKTEALEFDRLMVCVGRRPLTAGIGLEAAGIETDPKTGGCSRGCRAGNERSHHLRDRRHRRRSHAGPQGLGRRDGRSPDHRRQIRRGELRRHPVHCLHRARGGERGADRGAGQGARHPLCYGGLPLYRQRPRQVLRRHRGSGQADRAQEDRPPARGPHHRAARGRDDRRGRARRRVRRQPGGPRRHRPRASDLRRGVHGGRDVCEKIEELGRVIRGITADMPVLLAEQNALFALSIADRGYVIDKGVIRYEGARADLLSNQEVQSRYLSV